MHKDDISVSLQRVNGDTIRQQVLDLIMNGASKSQVDSFLAANNWTPEELVSYERERYD
jgi:hypothetical protein